MNITVWNENVHEKSMVNEMAHYPEGIHGVIAAIAKTVPGVGRVLTATLDQEACGLTDDILETTDVLVWWGHCAHDQVPDALVEKIQQRVLKGMGLIVLHSGHYSKIFKKMMGTSCSLRWRDNTYERLFCCKPSHPIAKGIPEHFELGPEETYGEFFDIPEPDDLIFLGWFDSGEVFRSGCTWHRGYGKIFYFQPGHETHPTYLHPHVQQIIRNACEWVAPVNRINELSCPNIIPSLEELRNTSNGQ